jgi:hypothetical protein
VPFCVKFGREIPAGSTFRLHCGAPVTSVVVAPPVERARKSKGKRRKLTPLGYIISIGGMLLAIFSYFFPGIDRSFLGLRGTLGLSDIFWAFIGDMIWVFGIMAILTVMVLKLGTRTIGDG